jgi:hypothetical protein
MISSINATRIGDNVFWFLSIIQLKPSRSLGWDMVIISKKQ